MVIPSSDDLRNDQSRLAIGHQLQWRLALDPGNQCGRNICVISKLQPLFAGGFTGGYTEGFTIGTPLRFLNTDLFIHFVKYIFSSPGKSCLELKSFINRFTDEGLASVPI